MLVIRPLSHSERMTLKMPQEPHFPSTSTEVPQEPLDSDPGFSSFFSIFVLVTLLEKLGVVS